MSPGWPVYPAAVNERAKDVLAQLEVDHRDAFDRPTIQTPGSDSGGQFQMTLFGFADHPLLDQLQELDLNNMTPIDALQFLQEAKANLKRPVK